MLLTDLRARRTEPATAGHRGQRPGIKRLRGHRSQSMVSTLVAGARRAAVRYFKMTRLRITDEAPNGTFCVAGTA
jgi:hypothetical protein